jgi:tRNA A37 threonylcarbamoyladenosine biosynthesis protein TsaE
LGFEDLTSRPRNIILIEWADRIEKILPKNFLKIELKHLKGNQRKIIINKNA